MPSKSNYAQTTRASRTRALLVRGTGIRPFPRGGPGTIRPVPGRRAFPESRMDSPTASRRGVGTKAHRARCMDNSTENPKGGSAENPKGGSMERPKGSSVKNPTGSPSTAHPIGNPMEHPSTGPEPVAQERTRLRTQPVATGRNLDPETAHAAAPAPHVAYPAHRRPTGFDVRLQPAQRRSPGIRRSPRPRIPGAVAPKGASFARTVCLAWRTASVSRPLRRTPRRPSLRDH